MVMKHWYLVLILIGWLGQTRAQGLSHIPAAFLDIGFGARALGMGGAFVAASDDVHSTVWNPAGLTGTTSWQGTFSYTRQLDIIPYSFLASSGRIDHQWAHGEALIVSGDELMREIRFMSAFARDFYNSARGLKFGWMLDFRYASFGREQVDQGAVTGEAYGFALNLGLQYHFRKNWVLGLKLQDIANSTAWITTGLGSYFEGTPFLAVWGLAVKNFYGFNFEADWHQSIYDDRASRFLFGAEKALYHYFVLRAGTARNISGTELNTQHALGFGLKEVWNDHLRLDFAYLIHDIQNYYRISVVFRRK
jgi:hypothetical protein